MPGGLEPEKLSTPADFRLPEAGDGQPWERGGIGRAGIETADSSSEEGICTILEHECDDAYKSHGRQILCEA